VEYFKYYGSMIKKMMQDAHVKLNPGLPWQKQLLTRKRTFSPANWTQIQGRTSKMVRLQHSFVWC